MKNRKGIIKMGKTFIQNIDNHDDLAESLFSNFFPTKIDDNGMERICYGRSPWFRELKDGEEPPTYKFYHKHGYNSRIIFGSFEEIIPDIDLSIIQQMESKISELTDRIVVLENMNLKHISDKSELDTKMKSLEYDTKEIRAKRMQTMYESAYGKPSIFESWFK